MVPIVGVTVSVTGVLIAVDVGDTATAMLLAAETLTVVVAVFEPALTVTVAVRFVVNVTLALPLASVIATVDDSVPAVVLNVTGTPTRRFPFASSAVAISVTVPPVDGTFDGEAETTTVLTFAPPIVIERAAPPPELDALGVVVPPVPVLGVDVPLAVPEVARISAVPDSVPAVNVATATPLCVCASAGSIVPSVLVNRTVVPFWTAEPLDSSTVAVTCVVPPVGSVNAADVSEIVELVGAVSGILSQATNVTAARTRRARQPPRATRECKPNSRNEAHSGPMSIVVTNLRSVSR